MREGWFWRTLSAFNFLVYVFLLAPILVIVPSSLGKTSYLRFPPEGLTLSWYRQALADPEYWSAFYTSVWLGVWSAVLALLLGGAAAIAIGRYRVRGGAQIANLLMSPVMLPTLVLGLAVLLFTSQVWGAFGIWRLVAAHVVITVPYTLRTLLPALEQISGVIEEAAGDLGANAWTRTLTITLPMVAPAVISSVLLAFMISFDEIVTALFLAPPNAPTLPMQIYSKVQFSLDPTVGAVSTLLLVLTVVVMAFSQLLTKLHAKVQQSE